MNEKNLLRKFFTIKHISEKNLIYDFKNILQIFHKYFFISWQISRKSAGNVKRTKEEIAADPEEEDEYGYTTSKHSSPVFSYIAIVHSIYFTNIILFL